MNTKREHNEHFRGYRSFEYFLLKKNSLLEYNFIYQGLATNEPLMLIYCLLPLLKAI